MQLGHTLSGRSLALAATAALLQLPSVLLRTLTARAGRCPWPGAAADWEVQLPIHP